MALFFKSDCKDTKFLSVFQIFWQLFFNYFSVLTIHFLHFYGSKLSPKGDKKYSQCGNVLFPTWEHFIPSMGIFFINQSST
jgi:hypothetical protein